MFIKIITFIVPEKPLTGSGQLSIYLFIYLFIIYLYITAREAFDSRWRLPFLMPKVLWKPCKTARKNSNLQYGQAVELTIRLARSSPGQS